jgi:hypothetical protein
MRGSRTSLRRRLTGACLGLTLTALTATGFYSYSQQRQSIETGMSQSLETLARMVAANVQSALEFSLAAEASQFLATAVHSNDMQAAAVFMPDGRLFAASGDAMRIPPLRLMSGAFEADWVGWAPVSYHDQSGEPRTAHVIVRAAGDPLRERLLAMLSSLVSTAGIAVLVLIAVTHWLIARMQRPVAALV